MRDDHDAMKAKAREYLKTKGSDLPGKIVRERIAAAFDALDAFLDTVPPDLAAVRTIPREWSVQEIVDHLVETHHPGVDELRCLLAGQRPPGDAIPAGLLSKAPLLRPWSWLRRELRAVHDDILTLLDGVPSDFTTPARAPLIMVVNVPAPGGGTRELHWEEDLDWKAYSIVWRVHAVAHLNQAKKVMAAATS
jgi:hypothetical protein